jgi:hypothetical protein
MVAMRGGLTTSIPLKEVSGKLNLVPANYFLVQKARSLDIFI